MLSREKGQTSGSRPEAAGLFPPNVFGAREGSVNRSWWAVRNAKDAATIRPTKIPATRARLTRIRAAFPFAYIWGRGTRWSLHPGLVKSITDDFWRSILHDQQDASTWHSFQYGRGRDVLQLRLEQVVGESAPRIMTWISRARPARSHTHRAMEETLYSLSIPAPTLFRWSAERGAGLRRLRDLIRLRHRRRELGPRRMGLVPRGHRVRRRSGRPHRRGRLGGRRRAGHRPEGGHRSPGQSAEQHPLRDARRLRAVVRLV